MREGLRSRKRLEKPEGDKVSERGVVQDKGHVIKQEKPHYSGEDSPHEGEALDSAVTKKEVENVVECEFNLGTSTNVGLVENETNRRALSFGENTERKARKEEDSNDIVQIGGRVLRSQLKREDGKKSSNEDNNVVLLRTDRECCVLEKIQVKAGREGADEYISYGCEKKKVKENKEGNVKRKLKRKRGRPPKMEVKKQDAEWQRKRGRPPKAEQNCKLMKVSHSRNGIVDSQKGKKGLTMKHGANTSSAAICLKRRSFRKELKKEIFSRVKIENNGVASPLRSNSLNVPVAEKKRKSKAKQLVRDQIMELLTAAGWTVDYRPRNGRCYNDAVYVSLDGRTHWSITLAYNRLKKHYEDGDGEGKVYGPGFKFTPIPEEEFKTLTKVMNKKREDKKKMKQKGKKGGNKATGIKKKVKKEKQGSSVGLGRQMKGKMKRKWSITEEDNSYVMSPNGKRQKTRNRKRSTLLVRDAEKEIDSEVDGYVPYNGKRTVFAWMIHMGTVLDNGKVHYMNHIREGAVLEGRIRRDGIHCGCCNDIVTISEFETHAGSKLSDPFRNIYIEGGTSLLQCLLDSWNKQDESERKGFHFVDVAGEDPNDDTCGVCGDGGDLICCDGCPSTFHQSCLGIKKFPSGDWHCIYCCCKFCGLVGSASQREDYGDITESALLTCHSCEKKYHRSCFEADGVRIDDSSDAFCGNRCKELYERLKMLLGVKHEIEDGFSWTFIYRSDVGSDASQIKSQMVEYNSKLAVALLIMDECFMPYIDHRSGINLIHSILYNCGSNFNRLNHGGFITAILERGDEIICAASLRIHGNQLAEMPFVGTRSMYRRQGMCRRLLRAIERALSSLDVGLLVIPAIAELTETWTSVFGFEPLDQTSNQMIKNMNLLVFPHVDMLQKKIPKVNSADANLITMEVSNPQLQKNQKMSGIANNRYESVSSGSDMIISAGVPASDACQIIDKSISIESRSELADDSFNNIPPCDSETALHQKCSKDVQRQVVCHAICHNLTAEDNGTIEDNVSNGHYQAEQIITCQNATSAHHGKTVDLDNSLKDCRVSEEGEQILTVLDEIVTNSNSAEDSSHHLSDSIPFESQIVSCTKESKDSDKSTYHDSKNIIPFKDDGGTLHHDSLKFLVADGVFRSHKNSDSCELISDHGCMQPHSVGSKELHSESINCCGSQCRPNGVCVSGDKALPTGDLMRPRSQSFTKDIAVNCIKPSGVISEPNADEAEVCAAKAPNFQTLKQSENCQSIQTASGSCGEIVNGIHVNSEASSVSEFNFLSSDRNLVLNNNPRMDHSLELPEHQATQSNGPSLCSPSNAGVALNCASAGGTSCGGSEVIVLSNKAS